MNRNRKRGRKLGPTLFYIIAILCFTWAATSALNTGSVPSDTKTSTYTVEPGDTEYSIASKFDGGLDPRNVCDWLEAHNHISDGNLVVGTSLVVPVGGGTQ